MKSVYNQMAFDINFNPALANFVCFLHAMCSSWHWSREKQISIKNIVFFVCSIFALNWMCRLRASGFVNENALRFC